MNDDELVRDVCRAVAELPGDAATLVAVEVQRRAPLHTPPEHNR